jgi:glutamyl-tRNA synthetase
LPSTPGQIYLQQALGFSTPQYAHIPLFCAQDGRRLAKRNAAASIDELLNTFSSFEGVLGHIAYVAGLKDEDAPANAEELLADFKTKGGIQTLKQHWESCFSIEFMPS